MPERAAVALVRAFREIHATRMHGLPFINGALEVEAVGFVRWREHWLGALVTPWFMNLVMLPDDPRRWTSVPVGDSCSYAFPAGVFEFIAGFEPQVGEFQSCSLFSPMFEFQDQASARLTAHEALRALFDIGNAQQPDEGSTPIATPLAPAELPVPSPGPATAIVHGSAEAPAPAAAPVQAHQTPPAPPLSKRDFLRGEFLARPHEPER